MSVLQFPKKKFSNPRAAASGDSAQVQKTPGAKQIFSSALLFVRLPLFLVLYWLRLPVVFVCNLISIPLLLAWLFSLYAFPDKQAMIWGFAIISFIAFVVAWAYDYVLMALSPNEMTMVL